MVYLHIPFCHRKCTYCAFYSVVTAADKQAYVEALCRELDCQPGDILEYIPEKEEENDE